MERVCSAIGKNGQKSGPQKHRMKREEAGPLWHLLNKTLGKSSLTWYKGFEKSKYVEVGLDSKQFF